MALCVVAISFTLTGCIAHTARGIGEGYSAISGAKDRDHALTHASREETIRREKKTDYLDKYATCISQNGGRSEPCKGWADLVREYDAVTGSQFVGVMDPRVEAIVYESMAIGRWEDWGQNEGINRNSREIATNSARLGLLEEETAYIWDSLDRIETEYREWDAVYDENNLAEVDAILDELDELRAFVTANGSNSAADSHLTERIEDLERSVRNLKGGK